ncbi:amidohydrolase [Ferrovibrio sp.]|uniref:amidohydrolase family protein n=1 Tax=Ferrovibrio sp. TaxID=1917215 RepID=UPI0025BFA357|nr:amidohydrolase family protein [Ferrovibrio sp.]MBX3456420.1 amidohydrolase family protein [Ferrovibrio sp.]
MTTARIDAHQHYWRLDRGDYGWLTSTLTPIYRDVGPDDLAPHLLRHDIHATIAVQAAPTEAETHYLLDIARTTPSLAGVVGWIDFDAADALARLDALAADPLLLGLRPMVQDIADSTWLLRPGHTAILKAMARHGLVFDALVKPIHLPPLLQVASHHPAMAIVIDHGAKPVLTGDRSALTGWYDGIKALAELPNVHCKLSGLVTEFGKGWRPDDLLPAMQFLLNCFGAQRLIWGSDWPVIELAARYQDWFTLCRTFIASLPAPDQELIMGGNAAALYLSRRGKRPSC